MYTNLSYKIILFLISLFFIQCQKANESVASFTYQEGYLFSKEGIKFNNTSINDYSHEWDFGDGTLGYENGPTHFYEHPGNYSVVLTIKNAKGIAVSTTQILEVVDRFKPKSAKVKEVELAYNAWYHWNTIDYVYNGSSTRPDLYYELKNLNTGNIIASSHTNIIQNAGSFHQLWFCEPAIVINDLSSIFNLSFYDQDGSYTVRDLMFSRNFILEHKVPQTAISVTDTVIDTTNKRIVKVEWDY